MNELNETPIDKIIDSSREVIESLEEQWEEYKKALAAVVQAAKHNPHLTENEVKRLEKFAVELRNETEIHIFSILSSIEYLAKMGAGKEIYKIITTAAKIFKNKTMGFDEAVKALYWTTRAKIDLLENEYPGIKTLTITELAGGGAIDHIAEELRKNDQGKSQG